MYIYIYIYIYIYAALLVILVIFFNLRLFTFLCNYFFIGKTYSISNCEMTDNLNMLHHLLTNITSTVIEIKKSKER